MGRSCPPWCQRTPMARSWPRPGTQPTSYWRDAIADDVSSPLTEGETPGLMRRRRRTRADVEQRICDAARQLFAERGYAGTATREIARQADVSETLLFRYYGDK